MRGCEDPEDASKPHVRQQKNRHLINVPVESHQYSDGNSSVVALRSASVMIQIRMPVESV